MSRCAYVGSIVKDILGGEIWPLIRELHASVKPYMSMLSTMSLHCVKHWIVSVWKLAWCKLLGVYRFGSDWIFSPRGMEIAS